MKLWLPLLALIIFFSCQDTEDAPLAQGGTIYYYPGSNIYFDADNGQYFLFSGAAGWTTTKELQPEQEANLGRKVLVSNPTVPVWKANDDHKMIYGASLYTTADDYNQKFKEDSLNSLPRKKPADSVYEQKDSIEIKKERKGVGKFLERLFGKDRKRQKNQELHEKEGS